MKTLNYIIIAALLASTAIALDLPPGLIALQEYQQTLAFSVTLLIAFIGGILSFTSPCGFVVLPAFFSYVFKERKQASVMTAWFSLGMLLAFVIFGIIAGLVGNFFNDYKEIFGTISGFVLIIFGFMLIFNLGFSLFQFKMSKTPSSALGMFLLGFFFAVGWSPCVGPILGGIILLAANTANMVRGATLLGFYALGVALPLMLFSKLSDKYDLATRFQGKHIEFDFMGTKIHTHTYGIIGGILLIIVGLIMFATKGTRIFMQKIPEYLPWSMEFFNMANERLVEPGILTGWTGNIIGLLLGIFLLYLFWRAIKHKNQ